MKKLLLITLIFSLQLNAAGNKSKRNEDNLSFDQKLELRLSPIIAS